MHEISKTHQAPTLIAPETYVIHDHEGEGTAPVCVPLNSMVIRGAEPVVVDTGMAENQDQYLADVFGLVEPEDIRWVFISHDDVDHTGNLNALMARATNATLVVDWFMVTRMGATLEVPPTRQRWLRDGDGLDVGDRVLQAVRPPIFDSPTTRGVYDPTTGVYWASDSFATPMPHPMPTIAELDPELWAGGMTMFNNYISPWLDLVDDAKFQRTIDRIEALQPTTMVGCHTPVISATRVAKALEITRRSVGATYDPQPDQATLELIQATFAEAVA
jgi:flavorubredoxin